ncbi:MAG: phosphoribosylformylglycinamidine synthase, partial [Bremerella sp.]
MTLWEVDIYPASGHVDRLATSIVADAEDLQIATHLEIATAHGFLVQADFDADHIKLLADQLLVDNVVERAVVAQAGEAILAETPSALYDRLIYVMPKPGVMDPVAQSTQAAIADFGNPAEAVRTFRKYWIGGLDDTQTQRLVTKLLANDSVEQVIYGPMDLERLSFGKSQPFELKTVNIRSLDDDHLQLLSKEGQLYLTLVEMQTIQKYFQELGRDPTDIELETVAQTWSEHCSHKTLAGKIAYKDEKQELHFDNMLKETIFAATQQIRKSLGDDDWCVSVFKDNAGIVTFNDAANPFPTRSLRPSRKSSTPRRCRRS